MRTEKRFLFSRFDMTEERSLAKMQARKRKMRDIVFQLALLVNYKTAREIEYHFLGDENIVHSLSEKIR